MFGKYYILRKNGSIEDIVIQSEEKVILSLQKSNNSLNTNFNCAIIQKKYDYLFLTEHTRDIYLKLKSYVDSFIDDKLNPTHVISSTIFKKMPTLKNYKNCLV